MTIYQVEGFTTAHQDRIVATVIEPMAKDGLRTISIAYRDFVPGKAEKNQVHFDPGTGKNHCSEADYIFSIKVCYGRRKNIKSRALQLLGHKNISSKFFSYSKALNIV